MKIVKITVGQRLLLSLGLVGGVIALAFLPAAHHVSYIRYVSPPLPDGTHYTFLRPTYLTRVEIEANNATVGNSGSTIQCVRVYPHTSFLEGLMPQRLRMLFFFDGNEQVSVEVNNAAKGNHFSRSTLSPTPDEYTEEHGVHYGWTYHNVNVNEQKAGLSFSLNHAAGSNQDYHINERSLAIFQRSDATITHSFRILPPGVAAPSP